MQNDAIIFDIDGTLWNASASTAEGWSLGLKKLGINRVLTAGEIASVTGNPSEVCMDILMPGLRAERPEFFDTLEGFETKILKNKGGEFYGGVIEGIKTLSQNYKIFLVSNCQEWYLKLFLKFSGLKSALTGIDCNGLSGQNKAEMLKRMKADYSLLNPVYVGDTAGDQSEAERAGIDFIHVAYGFGRAAGNPKSFDAFGELVEYFEKQS